MNMHPILVEDIFLGERKKRKKECREVVITLLTRGVG